MSNDPSSTTEHDGLAEQPDSVVPSSAVLDKSIIDVLIMQLRRFFRAVLIMIVGALCGAAIGFVVFLLLQSLWETLSDWQTPPALRQRSRGGDPIDNWARGYVTMFYSGMVMTPFVFAGLWLGIRIACLGHVTFRQQFSEIVRLLRRCAATLFSISQLWGRLSILLAVTFWPVGLLGLSSLRVRDSPARLCVVLFVLIAASSVCGVKGMRAERQLLAIVGLLLTVLNMAALSRFLYQVGLERLL